MVGVGGQEKAEKLAKACGLGQKWTLREARAGVSPLPHPALSRGPQHGLAHACYVTSGVFDPL